MIFFVLLVLRETFLEWHMCGYFWKIVIAKFCGISDQRYLTAEDGGSREFVHALGTLESEKQIMSDSQLPASAGMFSIDFSLAVGF
jgi:hypothetical protein